MISQRSRETAESSSAVSGGDTTAMELGPAAVTVRGAVMGGDEENPTG